MKYFKQIDLGWTTGDIGGMFKEALMVANVLDVKVSFEFNGVKVNISKHSTIEYVYPRLQDAIQTRKLSCFGEGW